MDILSKEAILQFSFSISLLCRGQLLKEKKCFFRSKFFPQRVYPFKDGGIYPFGDFKHLEKEAGRIKINTLNLNIRANSIFI